MREALAKRIGARGRFTATFTRRVEHTRGGHYVVRLLFHDVRDETGAEVTDHIHFTEAKCWARVREGDRVRFEARVGTYWKGYRDERHRDYNLKFPTNITVLGRRAEDGSERGQLALL